MRALHARPASCRLRVTAESIHGCSLTSLCCRCNSDISIRTLSAPTNGHCAIVQDLRTWSFFNRSPSAVLVPSSRSREEVEVKVEVAARRPSVVPLTMPCLPLWGCIFKMLTSAFYIILAVWPHGISLPFALCPLSSSLAALIASSKQSARAKPSP